ncbi:PLP-dependent cysteine synthase family protein [Nisaea denitrificans]|uniref:PLP-dependent cysteine synthase family protein n=1 Tax=Nisaea denitrificans TaxID=390877 RepID=UPI000409292B|nr:cysteine synthase family protein [Nisaea denitrificans]
MINVENSILSRIGNTPLIELKTLVPEGSARVLLKIESENPTGSMKDRMALAMIEAAERDGRLQPGAPVVEYTGGSTGVSLAMVCAVKGYPLHIVSSEAFSIEKRRHMQALGADLTVVPSAGGRMDAALTHAMIAEADRIRGKTGACWTDQLKNADQLSAYHAMGAEIWQQTDGMVDAFVQTTGTAASARGVSEFLKSKRRSIRTVAIEPSESAVLSGGKTGAHRIEGVGAGFVVPLWDPVPIDEVATVSTGDAMAMARRLAREEGIFAGTSTGANVNVALRVAADLGPNHCAVTIMCDSGVKYLSTELYNRTDEADE